MVPTLTWGLVRSNFPFAISPTPKKIHTNPKGFSAHPEPDAPESGAHGGNRTPDLPPTTEPHGPSTNPYQRDKQPAATDDDQRCPGDEPANGVGAGGGNRTRVISL